MPPPMNNPTVTLSMNLDVFNEVQRILSRQPFEDVADMILTFKQQVQMQLVEIERKQREEAMAERPPRPSLVERLPMTSDQEAG